MNKTTAPVGIALQPVNNIVWIDRNELYANDYNPNRVPPKELELLRVSLLSDGWALPLVVLPRGPRGYQIVDGFHRWTIPA